MKQYKKLAGQTIVYGFGTIVPRILNYAILTFWFTRKFEVHEFGRITELYAYVTFLLVILTLGMETAYFRFANRKDLDKRQVFSSVLVSLLFSSILFILFILFKYKDIAIWLKYPGNEGYIIYIGMVVAFDAFSAIPFAKLRQEEKAKKFAFLKILQTVINVICLILFIAVLPAISNFEKDVKYVLIANLISSSSILLFLTKEIFSAKIKYVSVALLKPILKYSLPLMLAGLAGVVNETLDRILFKQIITDTQKAEYMLGIYGANYKIAILLSLLVMMFRYAAEPFYFNNADKPDAKETFSKILRLFFAITLICGSGIILFIDIVKYFIAPKFHEGLDIVPIVLSAYIFYGIFFNLSIWYKLTDRTRYGAIFTFIGACVTITINVTFLEKYGYYASAYAHLISYFIMVVLSYLVGRKYYKINYKISRILEYSVLAIIIYFIDRLFLELTFIDYIFKIIMISVLIFYITWREKFLTIRKELNL